MSFVEQLSYVDFYIAELIDIHKHIHFDTVAKYERLNKFWNEFNAIPEIASYRASESFKLPLNNKSAQLGGDLSTYQEYEKRTA